MWNFVFRDGLYSVYVKGYVMVHVCYAIASSLGNVMIRGVNNDGLQIRYCFVCGIMRFLRGTEVVNLPI